MAWTRLAEYFARFKLSLGLPCSLEVLAPNLSRVPLYIQPTKKGEISAVSLESQQKRKLTTISTKKESKKKVNTDFREEDDDGSIFINSDTWNHGLERENDELNSDGDCKSENTMPTDEPHSLERWGIWKATQLFLGRPIDLANVSHAVVPIRKKGRAAAQSKTKKVAYSGPKLEVVVIVHGPNDDVDELDMEQVYGRPQGYLDEDDDEAFLDEHVTRTSSCEVSDSARMVLVRMVNKIPLLDSAEAVACGLVQSLSSKKRMWNSFGLEVSLKHDSANVGKLPYFEVRDSEQVAPFFKKGAHNLLENDHDSKLEYNGESDNESDGEVLAAGTEETGGTKRKRPPSRSRRRLLPASVRLGNILVIAQIHAEPTSLPLPTLSKVRMLGRLTLLLTIKVSNTIISLNNRDVFQSTM